MNNTSTRRWTKYVFSSALLISLLVPRQNLFAQNLAINTDGSKASPNAIVDIKSTTKGLLIPRMTTSQRQLIPQTNGLLVYDIDTKSFWYSNGKSWQTMAAVSSNDAWLTTGNSGIVDSVNFLGTINRVPLNIRVGNERSGRIDIETSNAFWGFRAGSQTMPFATSNTGIGYDALYNLRIGNGNTAVGMSALGNDSVGGDNTAVGHYALEQNQASDNTAVGALSLYNNTTGNM